MINQRENGTSAKDMLFNCPIRNVLSRVGDKWSLLTLYALQHSGPLRFKQLQRELPDISQKSLTQTLRVLEEDGFVTRKVYAEVPPRVEYSITDRSRSFLLHVNDLIGWVQDHMADIISDRERYASQ